MALLLESAACAARLSLRYSASLRAAAKARNSAAFSVNPMSACRDAQQAEQRAEYRNDKRGYERQGRPGRRAKDKIRVDVDCAIKRMLAALLLMFCGVIVTRYVTRTMMGRRYAGRWRSARRRVRRYAMLLSLMRCYAASALR